MARKKKKTDVVEEEGGLLGKYKHIYKLMMIFPFLLFLLSFYFIFVTIEESGTPFLRDISLKGGLSLVLSLQDSASEQDLHTFLKEKYPSYSFSVSRLSDDGVDTGYVVDSDLGEDELVSSLEEFFGRDFVLGEDYSSNFISESLSSAFFKQAMVILCVSFVLMSVVIFLYFKELVPSFAVVLSGLFDIIVTVGFLDAFGFQVSIAGVGSLLMLIGYSIDTDILLTNRLLKEEGKNYFEKAFSAFKTGTLMSLTTVVAGLAALILTNSQVIYEIALILVVGLAVDYVSTWMQNTAILLWWLERRTSKGL